MNTTSSPDVKAYRAPDIERIGVDCFAFGFLCGVVTLTVLILTFGVML